MTTMTADLAVGTPVEIIGGYAIGVKGVISRSYTIRFGHRMYDIKSTFGFDYTYYGPEQVRTI